MNPFESMQQFQSFLSRKPTIYELDKFIDRVLNEKDETPFTLFQAIKFKLEHKMCSPAEAEILPMVLQRIAQRYNGN